MDNLRLILIIAGVALLAGIYVWGVAFAKRRDTRGIENDLTDPLEASLDGIQDIRAAKNVHSLANEEDFDIDRDLDREFPAGERLGERRPGPGEVESEANEIGADDGDRIGAGVGLGEGVDEPVTEGVGDSAGSGRDRGGAMADADTGAVPDRGYDSGIGDLPAIRATRAEDDEVPMGQLDLLRFDDETNQAPPPGKDSGNRKRKSEKRAKPAEEATAVAITVMAREGERFAGADLRRWMQNLGLEHGEMGIFHRRERGKSRRAMPQFSVANVVKPGTFDPAAMGNMTTPGVAMFIQLPGPDDPGAAFEEMIRTARKLAEELNGIVCDETRSTLTGQVINHMRERISEFTRKQRIRS